MKFSFQNLIFFLFVNIVFSQTPEIKYCKELINKAVNNIEENDFAKRLEFLFEARSISLKENLRKEHFLSNNNIGLMYFKMSDYNNALNYLLEAYEVALDNKSAEEKMTVLNNIALVYVKDKDYKKAKEYLNRSYDIAVSTNNKVKIGYYTANLAELNFYENNLDKANKYLNVAILNLEDNPKALLNALVIKYAIEMEKGDYGNAIQNFRLLLLRAKELNHSEIVVEIHLLLATAYSDIKNWELARKHIDDALIDCENNDFKIKIYNQQSKIAYALNDMQEAVSAKDSVIRLTNMIYNNEEKLLLKNSKLQFELKQSQNDLEISKIVSSSQKRTYLIIAFFILLLTLFLIWILYKEKETSNQKREIAENNLKLNELKLQQEENKICLLNKELKEKNKELYNKALFQSTRNELIENVVESIVNIDEIPKNAALKKSIFSLKQHLKESVKWDKFSSSFENINNTFVLALKANHPNLNANDIRFVSYIYLNLNNKEIASILNITPEACRKRKERLKNKLNITSGMSLFKYFSQIS